MKKNFELATVNTFRFFNLVNTEEETISKAESLVKYLVYDAQLASLIKALPLDAFEKAHPGTDFWTAGKELFTGVVDDELITDVLEVRENALTVKEAIKNLPHGLDAWNVLADCDRFFLTLEAHKTVNSIVLDKSLFKSEKGVDLNGLGKVVAGAYASGMAPKDRKALIETLRAMFFKVCGNGGELFTGLSYTRSEIGKSDLMNFCATFGGRAKRVEKKDKKAGTVTVGKYDYVNKFDSWKTQSVAITTLLGVIMEARQNDYCKVVRG